MKKIVTYITAIASALVISTTAAEARPHHGQSSSKAHPSSQYITTYQKVFSHYDCRGHAIYTYRKVIVRKSGSSHHSKYSHRSHQPQYSSRGSSRYTQPQSSHRGSSNNQARSSRR